VVDAQLLESQRDKNGNRLMMGSWAIEHENENGILMREYHVDCHPEFLSKYIASKENKKLGGNLSMHKPVDCCPKLLIGQDECIIKENLFSAKQWNGSEGQNVI